MSGMTYESQSARILKQGIARMQARRAASGETPMPEYHVVSSEPKWALRAANPEGNGEWFIACGYGRFTEDARQRTEWNSLRGAESAARYWGKRNRVGLAVLQVA